MLLCCFWAEPCCTVLYCASCAGCAEVWWTVLSWSGLGCTSSSALHCILLRSLTEVFCPGLCAVHIACIWETALCWLNTAPLTCGQHQPANSPVAGSGSSLATFLVTYTLTDGSAASHKVASLEGSAAGELFNTVLGCVFALTFSARSADASATSARETSSLLSRRVCSGASKHVLTAADSTRSAQAAA